MHTRTMRRKRKKVGVAPKKSLKPDYTGPVVDQVRAEFGRSLGFLRVMREKKGIVVSEKRTSKKTKLENWKKQLKKMSYQLLVLSQTRKLRRHSRWVGLQRCTYRIPKAADRPLQAIEVVEVQCEL